MPNVKYRQDRRTALTDNELSGIRVRTLVDDGQVTSLVSEGLCPTCDHRTRQIVPVSVIAPDGAAPFSQITVDAITTLDYKPDTHVKTTPNKTTVPIVISCRCASDHPSADGKFGCGRSWMIRVTFDPQAGETDAVVSHATVTDLALWPTVLELSQTTADPVKSVRDSADKWQKALTAILGTIGIVAAIGGRDGIRKLADPWDDLVGFGVALFLLLGAWAAYLAHQAAIGFPSFKAMHSKEDLERWNTNPLLHAKAAVERLKGAVWLSATAFGLGLLTLLIFWRSPAATPASPKVDVTFSTGEKLCGTLLQPDAATMLKLRKSDGTTVSLDASNLTSISPSTC